MLGETPSFFTTLSDFLPWVDGAAAFFSVPSLAELCVEEAAAVACEAVLEDLEA